MSGSDSDLPKARPRLVPVPFPTIPSTEPCEICKHCGSGETIGSLHEKITKLETKVSAIYSDTAEIVEWVRTGKMGMHATAKGFSVVGKFLIFTAKIVSAGLVLYAFALAAGKGKLPNIKFFE